MWDLIGSVPDHCLFFYFPVHMLGLRLVVGNVVLSLQPGGGDALTYGLIEVRRKINGGALRKRYMK